MCELSLVRRSNFLSKMAFRQFGRGVNLSLFLLVTWVSLSSLVACDNNSSLSYSDVEFDAESDCTGSNYSDVLSDRIGDSLADSGESDVDSVCCDVVNENASTELPDDPVLIFSPSSVVDFGLVAVGAVSVRNIVVSNQGTQEVELVFEFPIEGDSVQEFSCAAEFPAIIPGGGSLEVPISFTNKGVLSGEISVTLWINSDIEGADTLSLSLYANHGEVRPSCSPSLIPEIVDFGSVVSGSSSTMAVAINNKGSGYCTFEGLFISDCENNGDLFDCPSPFDGEESSLFVLATDISTILKQIGPDETETLDITLQVGPGMEQQHRAGLLSLRMVDNSILDSPVIHMLPSADIDGRYVPNLVGRVVDSSD